MSHICAESMRIEFPSFKATSNQEETVRMAIKNYGHLIRSVQPKLITFSEFAAVIERHYDTSTPQTSEVVRVLRQVHAQNEQSSSEHQEVVIGGIFCGSLLAPNLYAEKVASARWVIRH